jgi:hypothetical protein
MLASRVLFFALFFFPMFAFSKEGHVYLGAQVGPSFAKLSKKNPQISYVSGVPITDAYPLNNNQAVAVMLNLNGGYEFTGANWKPAIALGVGVYFNPQDYHYRGKVIETAEGDPSNTLFNYSYKIKTVRALAEIQFTWILPYLSPFINFGLGPVWNKAHSFTETAVTDTGYTALPPFQAHTKLNVAFQVGVGVSAGFNFKKVDSGCPRERISVGYHYAYLGPTSFDTRGSDYPYPLKTGSLMTNDLYFAYTHLF